MVGRHNTTGPHPQPKKSSLDDRLLPLKMWCSIFKPAELSMERSRPWARAEKIRTSSWGGATSALSLSMATWIGCHSHGQTTYLVLYKHLFHYYYALQHGEFQPCPTGSAQGPMSMFNNNMLRQAGVTDAEHR